MTSHPQVRPPRVAVAGVYIVDVLGRPVGRLPRGQVSELIEEIRITPAGSAGGTAVDLARLGAEVVAIGATGNDRLGDFLRAALREEGIRTEHLTTVPDVQTSATILPITAHGERPAWHVVGANAHFGPSHVPWDEIATCDAVHLGGVSAMAAFDGAPSARLLAVAQAAGAWTTADCLGVKRPDVLDLLAQLLPHVDAFMPNGDEALAITGESNVAAAARRLQRLGASCVILTLGGEGCLILDDRGCRRLLAQPGNVVDTTGCGDAFSAGVIAGHCLGWEIDDAAELGIAAATLTMSGLGSDAGLYSLVHTVEKTRQRPGGALVWVT